MPSRYHLAQVNIGRILGPIDGPVMAGFVARLADINALADAAPAFVWRLQTASGNATELRPFADERILVNLSVWESPEQLREFVYHTAHAAVMRQRKQWFEPFEIAYQALWWIPAGHLPTADEAKERLQSLDERGETPFAFTFARLFPPPDSPEAAPQTGFAEPRPAL